MPDDSDNEFRETDFQQDDQDRIAHAAMVNRCLLYAFSLVTSSIFDGNERGTR
jgi:hypothetical protein